MAESRALAYKQKLDELMRLAKQPTAEAVRAIERLLADMSREISADLIRADPTSYNAARLKELKAAIERANVRLRVAERRRRSRPIGEPPS